jgi:hypothetical protein
MNKQKIYTLFQSAMLSIVMVMCSFSVYSQQIHDTYLETARYWEKEGDKQSAAYFYKEYIMAKPAVDVGIYYKCGMLMKDIFYYSDAELYLQKVVHSDSLSAYSDALFWLGMVQKNNAHYAEAQQSFQRYLSDYAADKNPILQKRVAVELKSFDLINKILSDTLPVEIKKVSDPVNTEHSDFNGVQFEEEALYFSSVRQISSSDAEANSVLEDFYMSMIFMAPYTVNGIVKIVPLPPVINNPKYHNGNFCFNQDKTKLYFTRCPIFSKKDKHCAIWEADFINEKWGKPQKLDKIINQNGSNTSQPHLAYTDDYQILFFVSDRKGGFGGMDIWYSLLHDNDFAEPVNLGNIINTAGDDITPFYHAKTKTLYFSSDWHEGLGGFDIFKSKGELGAWEKPINMGSPINSPANDMYFTVNEVDDDGFLTSNRIGSYYTTDETCCNDIYEYRWLGKPVNIHKDTFLVKNTAHITKSINDILPITLYFHNDEPNPRSLATTTDKDYKKTLEEYSAMKDLYKTEYSKGLQGEEKEKARADIDTFFTKTVGTGFAHLEQFTQWLLEDLEQGNNVTITIIGFASPLHSDDYNANLSSRRISSLKNYIYNQKIFDNYLDAETAGNKLRFIEDPRGKRFAAEYVSGNPNDIRNSIYSIAAGLERRIQITLYKSEKDTSLKEPNLLLSDNEITLTQVPDIDRYELYIQIKNSGNAELEIQDIASDNEQIKATITQSVLLPEETTFIRLDFSKEIFKKVVNAKIRVRSNGGGREVRIKN